MNICNKIRVNFLKNILRINIHFEVRKKNPLTSFNQNSHDLKYFEVGKL